MNPPAAAVTPGSDKEGKGPSPGKSSSRTITDTIVGEHEHTIVGYSLIKGIGDGEPIASERFSVAGFDWILLFYPDGKRSSSEALIINPQHIPMAHVNPAAPATDPREFLPMQPPPAPAAPPAGPDHAANDDNNNNNNALIPQATGPAAPPQPPPAGALLARPDLPPPVPRAATATIAAAAGPPPQQQQPVQHQPHIIHQMPVIQPPGNDYCALFVALIGEGSSPQGVVNTSEGRVVRAFHRFTLVDQSDRGQDVTKGRRRDQGAVKISCARQDPNARNCHGYRKFVKKSLLEDPNRGLLVNDTIIIRYQIELVVSTGGALSRHSSAKQPPSIIVPPPALGSDLSSLLNDGIGADVTFDIDGGERMAAHKIILQARSPVFRALLTGPMMEGHQDVVAVRDVIAPVFKALLHFAYSDSLPEDLAGPRLEVTMAQHLLAAADRFQLIRLRCICEQRLCETVEVETVATTLALAEQNNAKELKRVCLEFVSKHLQEVMATEGYQYMTSTCPQLQTELLAVIAATPPPPMVSSAHHAHHGGHHRSGRTAGNVHPRAVGDESSTDGQLRRASPSMDTQKEAIFETFSNIGCLKHSWQLAVDDPLAQAHAFVDGLWAGGSSTTTQFRNRVLDIKEKYGNAQPSLHERWRGRKVKIGIKLWQFNTYGIKTEHKYNGVPVDLEKAARL